MDMPESSLKQNSTIKIKSKIDKTIKNISNRFKSLEFLSVNVYFNGQVGDEEFEFLNSLFGKQFIGGAEVNWLFTKIAEFVRRV